MTLSRFVALAFVFVSESAFAQYGSRSFHAQGQGAAGEIFAQRCAFAGDVDHDGFGDLLLGTPNAGTPSHERSGEARVVSGATGGVLYSYAGSFTGQNVGYSVASGSDVDNDGHADFLIYTGGLDPVSGASSNVTLYSGATGLPLRFYAVISPAWNGVGLSERALAAAGDVDGDGMVDAVLGAIFGSPPSGGTPGATYVVSGASGAVLHSWFGDDDHELFGYAVSTAGDANADGHDDVIASAVFDDDFGLGAGSATVFDGKSGAALQTLSGHVMLEGFGVDDAGIGDVDGDGRADVAVGTGVLGSNVRVFSGANWLVLYSVHGAPASYFGSSLAATGDQDGDGRGDFLVGAVNASPMGGYSGSAFLYSGGSGTLLRTFVGNGPGERFGATVAGGGDSNGDGKPDLLVGAPGNGMGALPGAAYVFESACQTLYRYGVACAGSGGFVPRLDVTGCVSSGPGTLQFSVSSAFGGEIALFLAGFQPAWHGLGHGCPILLVPSVVPAAIALLGGSGPGNGSIVGSLTVDATELPIDFCVQAVTGDPGHFGYTVTNAVLIGVPGT